jgi:hypothetical protein
MVKNIQITELYHLLLHSGCWILFINWIGFGGGKWINEGEKKIGICFFQSRKRMTKIL